MIDMMGEYLTDHYGGSPGPGQSYRRNLDILVEETGSQRAAARALGIGESTLRGWLKGATPKKYSHRDIGLRTRAATINPDRWAAAYDGTNAMAIHGWIKVSRDVRHRTVHVGREIPQALMKRILTTWRNGRDNEAETLLRNAIELYYTSSMEFDQIEGVSFE